MSASQSPEKKLVVGMVGLANFGGHRRTLMRATGLFQIAAAFDRNPAALEAAQKQDGAKPVNSFEELLAFPGLEAIVISTGVDSHAPFAIQAMERGLHVFVEKPLCGRIEEIEQLVETRNRTKRIVGVGHSDNETSPVGRLIKDYLANGKIGTLAAYEENTSHSGGLEIKPGDWRGMRDKNPGGMLLQCGVHALHQLVYLFGPIAQVSCQMRYDANPNTQTADVANVLIRHKSGLLGTLNCYHITAYIHELHLFGTKGNLYIDTHAKKAWYQERKRGEVEPRVEVEVPKVASSDTANLINWFNAIRKGTVASPSLEDGIAAVLPVFASEISDQQGRTVTLDEVFSVSNV